MIDQFLYSFQIDLVKDIYGNIKEQELVDKINEEFNCKYTLKDLYLCLETEERLDKELTLKNLGFYELGKSYDY